MIRGRPSAPFLFPVVTRKSQQTQQTSSEFITDPVRLDKWLWAARFFKMRGLATDAIKHNQVRVNGQSAKPSRTVRIGDEIRIQKAGLIWVVTVQQLSEKRGSAPEAQRLYRESEESRANRMEKAAQNRAEWLSRPQPPEQRPDKRERARLRKLLLKA